VGFEVVARVEDNGAHRVLGGRLFLTTLGDGPSRVEAGASKPCVLRFVGRYLENARNGSTATFEPFNELNGSLARTAGRLEFTFLPTSQQVALKPNGDESGRRTLELDFDPASFRLAPPVSSELRTLVLPKPPDEKKEFRHFELGVVLVIDGAESAAPELNGVLDVPLAPLLTGLVVEWPADLDEFAPAGLTLIARQGEIEKHVRWSSAQLADGRRRLLFRGVLGPTPVDLVARFLGREAVLWERQDVSNEEVPPTWKVTLEQELLRVSPSSLAEPQATQQLASNQLGSRPSFDDEPVDVASSA